MEKPTNSIRINEPTGSVDSMTISRDPIDDSKQSIQVQKSDTRVSDQVPQHSIAAGSQHTEMNVVLPSVAQENESEGNTLANTESSDTATVSTTKLEDGASEKDVVASSSVVHLQSKDVNNTEIVDVSEPPAKRPKISENSTDIVDPSKSNSSITAAESTNDVTGSTSRATSKPIARSISTPPAMISTTQLLLPDYAAVRQTVKDLLAMLQLYGPLTANQLEYNLPPVTPTSNIQWNVHDVLSILVAIGLVQNVKGSPDQYCMFHGVPRATAIYPTDIPIEIKAALQEAEDSYKRCQILRDALSEAPHLTNNSIDENGGSNQTTKATNRVKNKIYKDVLKQLLLEYPQITNDPVYWTALRSCQIDMGGGSGGSSNIHGNMSNSEKRGGSSNNNGGATTSKSTSTTGGGRGTGKRAKSSKDGVPGGATSKASKKSVLSLAKVTVQNVPAIDGDASVPEVTVVAIDTDKKSSTTPIVTSTSILNEQATITETQTENLVDAVNITPQPTQDKAMEAVTVQVDTEKSSIDTTTLPVRIE